MTWSKQCVKDKNIKYNNHKKSITGNKRSNDIRISMISLK